MADTLAAHSRFAHHAKKLDRISRRFRPFSGARTSALPLTVRHETRLEPSRGSCRLTKAGGMFKLPPTTSRYAV